MRAGSSFTNFVTDGNVRQNPGTFEPDLYNKVGAVTGYPGPDTGVAAAAGNPGPKIEMKGGRGPAPGPNYQSFEDTADVRAGVFGKNLAPVKVCNNNMCGGRKSRKGMKKGKSHRSKRGHMKTRGRKMKKRATKKNLLKKKINTLKRRRRSRRYLKDVRDLFRMGGGAPGTVPVGSHTSGHRQFVKVQGGGSPAPVPAGSSSNGYVQYMSNVPFALSYSSGGKLAPAENALANPAPIHAMDNCSKK